MSDTSSPRPLLDHIVILVSPQNLIDLPGHLKDTLIVIDGGEHADGLTVNKLIIFSDGTYIELIAFQDNVDPEKRKTHRWGNLEEGSIIDWAYTLPNESDFEKIQQRVRDTGSSIYYHDPVSGGRVRPDGTVLKWAVASAKEASGNPIWPGYAPFWCLDRTPRHLRVPYQDEQQVGSPSGLEHTKHPSGTTGISQVAISVPEDRLSGLQLVYDGVHKAGKKTATNDQDWHFEVPSGSRRGSQSISLSAAGKDRKPGIKLTLLGGKDSPKSIELLPSVIFDIDTAT
ncbi:hypothetical protein G7046_g8391 [Stylonectria norvegica]|nr:hypothetical protein G7046_g8391 [Stylonectria norvegica]